MSQASFSMQELREASKVKLPNLETLTASDGVTLSYRRYAPPSPRAVVLFYHGGGAHSGAGYQYIGNGLQTGFDALVYTPDIRGHGASGGARGDAPSPNQVWEDITTFIQQIRSKHPTLPLFLGGHSSGAALTLNYASQPGHEPVSGYVFLSPQLGVQAQTDRPAQLAPFAKVDGSAFGAYFASGGQTNGHDYAVHFNYPADLLERDPGLVSVITVIMSVSLIPSTPHEQFKTLDRPFGLWIGADDELFMPEKVLAFADLATSVRADSQAGIIPGTRHLSVLINAHETIGPWIAQKVNQKII